VLTATAIVPVFRNRVHVAEDRGALVGIGHVIDRGVERPLFLPIMRAQEVDQRLLILIGIEILAFHLLVNRVQQLLDLIMLKSHHGRRPVLDHPGFLFPHREQQLLFPHDMPPKADFEVLERLLGLGEVRPFRRLEGLEQLIQPIVILFIIRGDGLLLAQLSPPMNVPLFPTLCSAPNQTG
jgi:hypothetical protein